MKTIKQLTEDEKKVYDSLETKELKQEYLKELKNDDKEDDNNDADGANGGNDSNSSDNGDIDTILTDKEKDLGDELDKKEDRARKNEQRQKAKDKKEGSENEKSSFLPYVFAVAVVAALYVYVTKKLAFKGNNGLNTVNEVYPKENYTESSNRVTEQITESDLFTK